MSAVLIAPQGATDIEESSSSLCVLLTCFNRCEKTLASLAAVKASAERAGLTVRAVLVDDGSTDGTAEQVRAAFSWVQVIVNDGPPLFWCRGMHRALGEALKQGSDYYLLLNDDTMLLLDAVSTLVHTAMSVRVAEAGPVLVVGSTLDANSAVQSYGGHRRLSWARPLTFRMVRPSDRPQQIDTFNGNVVLLPQDAVALIGNFDATYEHAMGDTDYGLRAYEVGVNVWLAPGFQGHCSNNPEQGTAVDRSLSFRKRWQLMLSRKGLPWRSWLHFTRRHTGWRWPLFFLWPYVRLILSGLTGVASRG